MPVTDLHVHLAALPDANNRCLASRRMLNGTLIRTISRKMGLPRDDPKRANQIYVERLTKTLTESRHVSGAVLLALDGVYRNGRLDESKTDFLISNDYLLKVVAASRGRFLAGVSINPTRRDAIDELDHCLALGAVLVKILPNTQGFDPADSKCLPFYKALARKKLPLLCHIGNEFALPSPWTRYTGPDSLRPALDHGVTVIFAHGCTRGTFFGDRFVARFIELTKKYPNLYADLSATTAPNRMNSLATFRRHPEIQDRLLFGTDYPVPVSTLPLWGRVSPWKIREIAHDPNPFDRQFRVLTELGIRFKSFEEIGHQRA